MQGPATFAELVDRLDELCHVLDLVDPVSVQSLARTSHQNRRSIMTFVRDRGGLRILWDKAWGKPVVVRRTESSRWQRLIVRPSWLGPEHHPGPSEDRPGTHAMRSDGQVLGAELVRVHIIPPSSVGTHDAEESIVMAWRMRVEWFCSGLGDLRRSPVASAEVVVDARGGTLGICHASRIPRIHRVSTCSTRIEDNGVARAAACLGWLRMFEPPAPPPPPPPPHPNTFIAFGPPRTATRVHHSPGMAMVETRSDGSIFIKVLGIADGQRLSLETCTTVRLVPDIAMRAVFWLHSHACR